ncbi:hypothetical protein ACOTXO_22305 [Enterobacter cloacae complex sp. CDL006]|uniref:hypothetical protein n=1 Tax=Enterobacter TaxID=547 RepID=UPI00068D892E|nr:MULTISPECIES: hypothetical protein [Enterobacter]EIY1158232.1 hypothetical protein [Enterobacter hormaechei]EKL0728598.1 hypothetical protein [Enterobacter hormaechei]EKS6630904.1 hypothetical protein [Enterobacter hormaechei]EKW1226019.1 hypothetical protein [Enterobacter hormaechei]EKW8496745.1 hypothetical protein [Enterobacter hormaechei]
MTNVSAVEKMAELMQQMEENSPRVVALQYCLKQVAEKVEEAEKRNAELEARCAALSAENSGLKSAIDATIGWQQSTDPENVESVRMLVDVKTPVTDAFLAEVRASAFNDLCAEFVKHKALAGLGDRQKVTVFEATEALLHCAEQLDTQFRKGVQS